VTDIQILRAEPGDADELTQVTIASKAHWGYPAEWMKKWASVLTITPEYIESHFTIKAVGAGRIAGYYSLVPFMSKGFCLLHNLFVRPEFMGQGVGRTLFEDARVQTGKFGAARMEWESDPNAVGFYNRLGARYLRDNVGDYGRALPVFSIDVPKE
jgi:GNAT superfamily N-acetyltransferase